eukprot:snap_masked-scaffold_37-processed-gene-1.27-mRNA-1 protein AED:1.00 eAED:1.00 QI:0/-1/0/0/-1/1/1/0/374
MKKLRVSQSEGLDLVAADFKPYGKWTAKEHREYTARAVRQHRQRQKQKMNIYLQAQNKLVGEVDELKKRKKALKKDLLNLKFFQQKETGNWSSTYLIFQNERLRKKAFELKAYYFLLSNSVKIKKSFPNVDPTQIFSVLNEMTQNVFKNFFNFKKTSSFLYNNRRINMLKNTKHYKRQLNGELSRGKKVKSKFENILLDQFLNSFVHFVDIIEDIPFLDFIYILWFIFTEKKYKNKLSKNYKISILSDISVESNKSYFDYFSRNNPVEAKRIKILKYTCLLSGYTFCACNVLHMEKDVAVFSSCALTLDEQTNKFVPLGLEALSTVRKIPGKKTYLQLKFSCINNEPLKRLKEFVPLVEQISQTFKTTGPKVTN